MDGQRISKGLSFYVGWMRGILIYNNFFLKASCMKIDLKKCMINKILSLDYAKTSVPFILNMLFMKVV